MSSAKIAIPTEKIATFCRRNHIRSLALFGSVLRDDFRQDSDVDVLIDFESDAEIGFLELGRIRRELAALLNRPVDLVLRDGLKPRVRDSVLSSAEIVYAGVTRSISRTSSRPQTLLAAFWRARTSSSS